MHVPIRPIVGSLPAGLERIVPTRLVWPDPSVVLDPAVTPEQFRTAMNAFNVGDTIKITAASRHPIADALLLDNVDLTGAAIVDIGASDGSTSLDLIAKLPDFASYTIADLYLYASAVTTGRHTVIYDTDSTAILIVGRRALAWPSISKQMQFLYRPVIARAARRSAERRKVLLLNPDATALIAADHRVTTQVHDVFTPWPGPPPDVIKVANLLRRLYFSDERIQVALRSILASLDDGGHLLMVDNPRRPDGGTRAGLYRRAGRRFVPVARTDELPEIDDLIRNCELRSAGGP